MKLKRILCSVCLAGLTLPGLAQREVSQAAMAKVYEEVKAPYKYGLVVVPSDTKHMADCPTVFRHDGRWYMTHVVFDGRGYETWLQQSDNLLDWKPVGRILSFRDGKWDQSQRGGFPALPDMEWGGSYVLQPYEGKYWMTYIGGANSGYEKMPLKTGLAWTPAADLGKAVEWASADAPIIAPDDKDAQWFERVTHYKTTVYRDERKPLGAPFMMFYNAKGVNPANGLKAERIGIALSDDLRHWRRYEGNPVLANEAKNTITGDAHIQRMGDLYVMFYFKAFDPKRSYKAYNTFACSYDLVHWYDWQGDDLVFPTEDYDGRYAHKSYVVKHDGVVYHFYCAVDNNGRRGIAVATSRPMGTSSLRFPD